LKSTRVVILMIILIFINTILVSCTSKYEFVVMNNITDIKKGIEGHINRGGTKGIEVLLKNKCSIDNILIVSYSVNNGMNGYSVLKKIEDDSYNILTTGYGTNTIEFPVITTNKGKYLVVIGKEYNKKIQYVKVELENKKYIFETSGESNFIQYYMVKSETTSSYGSNFWLFDNANNNITGEITLKEQ
jgi:hypothetical protein